MTTQDYNQRDIEEFYIAEEPFYVPTSDEIEI